MTDKAAPSEPELKEPAHLTSAEQEDAAAAVPLERSERRRVMETQRLRAPVVYEIIRREGLAELTRPVSALWWAGLSAGLGIGFSVVAEALIRLYMPDVSWRPLIENIGYTVGFLLVILGRLQLFTENTITAVIPLCATPTLSSFLRTARLWIVVLLANLTGATMFAAALIWLPVADESLLQTVRELSEHMMSYSWNEMLARGIVAGWLIASLVWIMPSIHTSPVLIIVLVTYLIALGDFTHVIAGTVEASYLVLQGLIGWERAFQHFLVPALIGNVLGGTLLFTMLAYSQVREEVEHHDHD